MNFLLFSGSNYYPGGGWDDFKGAFPTFEAAREQVKLDCYEWAHVVNLSESRIIWEAYKKYDRLQELTR